MQTTVDHARSQARAQLAHILELLKVYDSAVHHAGDDFARWEPVERAVEDIRNNALSVEVRGGWWAPGSHGALQPEEFRICLCTGRPAVQIVGKLDEHCEPESGSLRLQYQDWGTPWTDYPLDETAEAKLEAYCRHFYFGEG